MELDCYCVPVLTSEVSEDHCDGRVILIYENQGNNIMDYRTAFNRLNESLLASALQMVWFPFKTEQNTKSSALLDVDLFDLKRAYNVPLDVPVDLSRQFKTDLSDSDEQFQQSEEDDKEFEEHHPIEFCESLIDEEEEEEGKKDHMNGEEFVNILQKQEYQYNCSHCIFRGTVVELSGHFKQHHEDCLRSNWCAVCEVNFENDDIFKLHQVQEHIFYCSKCFQSFKTQSQLSIHMLIHNKVKEYECPVCKKGFPMRRYFVRHLERHEKKEKIHELKEKVKAQEKCFKCTECQKEFTKKESLVKHTKIHSRDSLKCSLCDFTCGKKVMLKMHVISHEGNRKYKCDHCDFSFKQIGHLKRHIARFNH